MAEYPEKGFVPVSIQPLPDPHSKGQDPPPPYPGGPLAGPSASYPSYPTVSPQYPIVSPHHPPDSVHLVVPTAPPPRDYVLWSLFNAILCNFYCLGFAALTFSIKSRDRLVMGDVGSAHRYGNSARRLNIAVVSVGIVTIIIFMIRCFLLWNRV